MSVLHALSENPSRTACGLLTEEAEGAFVYPDAFDWPIVATERQEVTCTNCKHVIRYYQQRFTATFNVKKVL